MDSFSPLYSLGFFLIIKVFFLSYESRSSSIVDELFCIIHTGLDITELIIHLSVCFSGYLFIGYLLNFYTLGAESKEQDSHIKNNPETGLSSFSIQNLEILSYYSPI